MLLFPFSLGKDEVHCGAVLWWVGWTPLPPPPPKWLGGKEGGKHTVQFLQFFLHFFSVFFQCFCEILLMLPVGGAHP